MKRIICLLTACVMMLCCAGASADTIKHERVYVVASPAGEALTLTDNVRLENQDKLDTLTDRTRLSNVQNMGGHETFTLDGETLTWAAKGADITYQGTSDQMPALLPAVTLTLDGQEVTAQELAQRSGQATLTVAYPENAETPALAVTLVMLPESGVDALTADNALLLSEAGRKVLVGWALPGIDGALNLPSSFSASFQADHADLSWMMTFISTSPIDALCQELDSRVEADPHKELDEAAALLKALRDGQELPGTEGCTQGIAAKVNELNSGLTLLNDSAKQLADGAGALADGMAQAHDGAVQLSDGAAQLHEGSQALSAGAASANDGAAQLAAGLQTLTANNEALNQGAASIFAAILDTANQQLAAAGLSEAGVTLPALTVENYAEALDQAVAQLDPENLRQLAAAKVEPVVKLQVNAKKNEIKAGVEKAAQEKVLAAVLKTAGLSLSAEQYEAAVKGGKIAQQQVQAVNTAVEQQMSSEAVKAQIAQAIEEQTAKLIQENVEKFLKEDKTVAAKLAQAAEGRESLAALKAQLDQIKTFVNGVAQYTAGAAQAAEGASALNAGLAQLSDGAAQLTSGAAALSTGAAQLSDGMTALNDGAAQLKDGAGRLQAEGTQKLADTLLNAEKDAAEKLLPYVENDLADALRVFEQTRDQARDSGYDLKDESMKSVTVYIVRTDLK